MNTTDKNIGAQAGNIRQGDASMTNTREEWLRRGLLRAFLSGGLGLFFLVIGLNRPSIANMRTIDLGHLLATGALLGVALASVVAYLVGRRKG
jgi:hypothetical protein